VERLRARFPARDVAPCRRVLDLTLEGHAPGNMTLVRNGLARRRPRFPGYGSCCTLIHYIIATSFAQSIPDCVVTVQSPTRRLTRRTDVTYGQVP
jgi:hypothetical protein